MEARTSATSTFMLSATVYARLSFAEMLIDARCRASGKPLVDAKPAAKVGVPSKFRDRLLVVWQGVMDHPHAGGEGMLLKLVQDLQALRLVRRRRGAISRLASSRIV